jgi:glyoxylase-like metal-dependent hydrolase (beta-lactamase superfamily II)
MTIGKTYQIGDAVVTRVTDLVIDSFTPQELFPDWQPGKHQTEMITRLPATLDREQRHVLLSIHTWVVRHQGRIILIDTGAGNDKPRPYARYFDQLRTPYLEGLAQAGVKPEDVDVVLTTHLHVDHVGWNTRLSGDTWVPTFANARYFFSKKEYAYFIDEANLTERNRTSFMVQKDSVTPVLDAGLGSLVDVDGTEPEPGFTLYPTPGHSVGHASIVLRSKGETALFSGDIFHHPFQIFHPELMTVFDADLPQTARSRQWGLDFAADNDAMVFSPHFPDSSAGHIVRAGNAFAWHFA